MNTNNPEHQSDENALAYAAISLCANATSGPEPEWPELEAWSAGTLPEPRSTQVLSYIANNPEIFQQWLDIAEAQAWVEEEAEAAIQTPTPVQAPSLLSRALDAAKGFLQQPLTVYGGAFAAVVLAVLVAPLLRTEADLTLQQQMNRSMDTYIETGQGFTGSPPAALDTRSLGGLFDELTVADVERAHFQSGLYQFNEQWKKAANTSVAINDDWAAWLAQLPGDSVDCSKAMDASHCTRVAQNLSLLGSWSLMNATACQALSEQNSPLSGSTFWSDQYPMFEQIRQLPEVAESRVFSSLLPEQDTPTTEAICNAAQSLLAAGYRGSN